MTDIFNNITDNMVKGVRSWLQLYPDRVNAYIVVTSAKTGFKRRVTPNIKIVPEVKTVKFWFMSLDTSTYSYTKVETYLLELAKFAQTYIEDESISDVSLVIEQAVPYDFPKSIIAWCNGEWNSWT